MWIGFAQGEVCLEQHTFQGATLFLSLPLASGTSFPQRRGLFPACRQNAGGTRDQDHKGPTMCPFSTLWETKDSWSYLEGNSFGRAGAHPYRRVLMAGGHVRCVERPVMRSTVVGVLGRIVEIVQAYKGIDHGSIFSLTVRGISASTAPS